MFQPRSVTHKKVIKPLANKKQTALLSQVNLLNTPGGSSHEKLNLNIFQEGEGGHDVKTENCTKTENGNNCLSSEIKNSFSDGELGTVVHEILSYPADERDNVGGIAEENASGQFSPLEMDEEKIKLENNLKNSGNSKEEGDSTLESERMNKLEHYLPSDEKIKESEKQKNTYKKDEGQNETNCGLSSHTLQSRVMGEIDTDQRTQSDVGVSGGCKEPLVTVSDDGNVDMDTEDPVVSYSKNQRWPQEGEAVCVICARYGEYICKNTEADVCSLECKARHLARTKQDCDYQHLKPEISDQTKVTLALPSEQTSSYSYVECLEIMRMTKEQIQDIRMDFEIFVEGIEVPRPILSFEQLFLPPQLLQNLKEVNYLNPTAVQMQVIPAALYSRDLMVCAQTSSGKTASFVLPSILHVLKFDQHLTSESGPISLILTPTRELAQQIEHQTKSLMKGIANMKTVLLVGGLPMPPQLHRLKQNIQVVIATPGRLLDIIRKGGLSLLSIRVLVIDEVDHMLHLGFVDQVQDIIRQLPDNHQTLLFSATIPSSIEKLASSMLTNPIYISIGTPSTPCSSVKQVVMWVEETSKKRKLFDLLEDSKHYQPPILIFVDSRTGADLLSQAIEKVFGIDVSAIHGDKSQVERSSILQSFEEGILPVLVSTGLLGRGLDLPGVKMVINFDMPNSVEDYIHQIGRTGRLGSKGTAVTFLNNGSKKLFLEFVKTLKPLGVSLPPELVSSPFLKLAQEQYQTRKHSSTRKRGKTENRSFNTVDWKADFKRRKKHKR